MSPTVLLADDQDLVRAGLRALMATDGDIDVVGEAADGRRAVELAARLRPDVVLMDIRMPRMDGIEATRAIRSDERLDATRVVILTTFDDDDDVL
ncbi:MAG TPA: response regulator transcription factor, partial [Agromyces sp.]